MHSDDDSVMYGAAANTNVGCDYLYEDPDLEVRCAVANNYRTSPHLLRHMAISDESEAVRKAAKDTLKELGLYDHYNW